MPIAWIVIGLISGLFGSKVLGDGGDGLLRYMALGVVGALVGGWSLYAFGASGASEFTVWSALTAGIGAVSALALYRAIQRRAEATH